MKRQLLIFGLIAAYAASHAVDIGVPDTFENGTTGLWSGGGTLSNVLDAPVGGGSRALAVGSASKLATYTESSVFTGDYLSTGATGVRVWMKNTSSVPLSMRVVFHSFSFVDRWTSATPVVLPVNSGWVLATFPLGESDLLHVLGTETYTQSLSNVWRLMFRHDTVGSSGGTSISGASIRLDSIEVVGPSGGFSGTISLSDFGGLVEGRTATVAVYQASNLVTEQTVTLGPNGEYTLPGVFSDGQYSMFAKSSHWLQQMVSATVTGGTGTVNFALLNGDVDGDNEVGGSDLSSLSGAFLSVEGDSNYVPEADLDGDGEVGSSDFSILSQNFLLSGDAP